MAYKIGDRVVRISVGDVCRIIATADTPHKIRVSENEIIGEYPVLQGYDYVVVSEDQLKSDRGFSPYLDVKEGEIEIVK